MGTDIPARGALLLTDMNEPLAIILAAGKGKRMGSDLPKVLLPVCGRAMIRYVIDAVHTAGIERILIVVGYMASLVRKQLGDQKGIKFVVQTEQLGTGHAVMTCEKALAMQEGPVLILAGDSPMVQASSLKALLKEFSTKRPACLIGTGKKADPTGLGRILRNKNGEFAGIVEEKDATPEQRKITEVNLSTYVFRPDALLSSLKQLTANNRQGEYYLTDCPGVLKADGQPVDALCVLQPSESLSINNPQELATVEAEMKKIAAANATKQAAASTKTKPKSSPKLSPASKSKTNIRRPKSK